MEVQTKFDEGITLDFTKEPAGEDVGNALQLVVAAAHFCGPVAPDGVWFTHQEYNAICDRLRSAKLKLQGLL